MPEIRYSAHLRWVLAFIAVAAAGWYSRDRLQPSAVAESVRPVVQPQTPATVGSLGRFVPKQGLLRIAAPYYESRPSVVAHLAVHEGQYVKRGQLIAVLDGVPQVKAERIRAAAQVDLARSRLEQVRAGTKLSEQQAQRAELQRVEAAYRLDQLQLARYVTLFASNDVSAAELDERRGAEQASRRAVEAARHRLSSISEVRDEDVRVAESELAVAQAQLNEIETRLSALTVLAPATGVVINIHARAGEQPGAQGILEMADTATMEVEAEVYASDLAAVRVGQRASIEPDDGGKKSTGEVVRIGAEVRQASVMPGDPASYNDARVVPVRIRVPACADMLCPINGRVRVVIDTAR